MTKMRAKMIVQSVDSQDWGDTLTMNAVGKSDGYTETGEDENNSYALWTPSAQLHITVTNPALKGQFREGQTFYVDFTETA